MKFRGVAGLLRHQNQLNALLYALGGLAVLLIQTAPHFFPSILGARPVPIVLYVVCVALFEGARVGALIGTVSGLLWGVFSARIFGFDALIMLAIGLITGLLIEWLLRTNFLSAVLLCAGCVLFQALTEWLFCYVLFGKERMLAVLLRVFLPNCAYTILLIPLVYWLVKWMTRMIRRRRKE